MAPAHHEDFAALEPTQVGAGNAAEECCMHLLSPLQRT